MRRFRIGIMVLAVLALVGAATLTSRFASTVSADGTEASVSQQTVTVIKPTDGKIEFTGTWEYPQIASTRTGGNAASYTGTFTQIEWYGEASQNMTSAKVYIDGNLIINHWPMRDRSEVNTSALLFTSGILPRGEHTIKVEHSGGGGWISVDKFVVYDDEAEHNKIELDDAAEGIYWSNFGAYTVADTYYGATVHSSNAKNAYMEYTAENVRQFVLWADRSYTRGRADVYIDGVLSQTVDCYDGLANDTRSYPVYVSPVLADGTHTIKVVVTGTKGIAATGCWIAIDKLEVYEYKHTEPQRTVKVVKPTDGEIEFTGTWEYPQIASTCTGGNAASYTGTFTQIEWYGEAGPYMTAAKVYIDGELVIRHWPIRDASETNTAECLFTSGVLPRGEHTITVEHDGEGWISVDKFVVYDDPVETTKVEIDDTDEDIQWSGFGAFGVADTYYGATAHSSNAKNAYMEYTAENVRQFVLWSDRAYTRGKADIYIDGVLSQTVDCYDGLANDTRSYPVYVSPVLADGTHTIKVAVTGTKGIKATDCWIAIDKLEVYSYAKQEIDEPSDVTYDDSSFGYHGKGWHTYNNLGGMYYMRSAHSSYVKGDYVSMAFNASSIAIYGTKAPNRGKAAVWLDGQQVGVVNTYSDVQTSSVRLWELTGLEAGVHEVRLVNLGETDGTGIWLEIDKAIVTGVESENMIIHALNNAFVTSNAKYVEQSPIGYYEMTAGEKATIRVRGSRLTLLTASGTQGTVSVSVNQNAAQLITLGASEQSTVIVENADTSMFHSIELTCTQGVVRFVGVLTDDELLTSLDSEMLARAREEIDARKDGTFEVSDPATWTPVEYSVVAPVGGVTLNGGLFGDMVNKNKTYLTDALGKEKGVDRIEEFWVNILSGSNDGRLLQGWANMLLWGNGSVAYREAMDAKLAEIRARQIVQDGYPMAYEEAAMEVYNDAAYGERLNYDRAMLTRGLVAAGNYYNAIGVPVADNLAYTILRDFYDWFNYHEKNYGASMLEGYLGVQGHIGSTLTYFTPVGVTADMSYAEYSYVQHWWMEYLAAGMKEAIWRYPLNRPHCYLITALDAYLDHYRATGDTTYLNACKSFWRMMKDSFIHTGGTMAICEHQAYAPGSYYTENANHTGELCGSVFWVDFNYKLLQLFPEEECYAEEIERSLINVLAAAQAYNGNIRYHQNLNGLKVGAGKINSCCEVTSIGMIANLPAYLYQVSDEGLTISLYNDSSIATSRNGKSFALTVDGDVTTDDKILIRVTGEDMSLRLRIPSWVTGDPALTINGVPYEGTIEKGAYLTLAVKTGDELELTIPKSVQAIAYTGKSVVEGYERYTFLYGPVLMAVSGAGTAIVTGEEAVSYLGMTKEEFLKTVNVETGRAGANGEIAFVPYYTVQGGQVFSAVPLLHGSSVPNAPTYDGCNQTLELSEQTLDLYSVNDGGMTIRNGVLFSSLDGGEQKAVFKDFVISDGMDIRFGVAPQEKGGRIDGGLYVGIREGVQNTVDAITAYNVNVERFVGQTTYIIKVHEFSYNGGNGKYLGCRAMAQFKYVSDFVNVRVYVKDGWFYVYNEDDTDPCIALKRDIAGTGLGLRVMSSTEMAFHYVSLLGQGEHSYNDWVETQPATCVKPGEKQRTCKHCPHIETEEIGVEGHDEGAWITVEQASATKEGLEELKCGKCGHVLDSRKLEKLPKQSGCGGSMTGGLATGAVALVASGILLSRKKRKEDQ